MSGTTTTIVGNLTREPELRFTTGGRPVANFGIAHTPRRNDNGTWVDGEPEYYDIEAWGTLGENVAESFTTGMRVMVIGKLRFSKWTDGEGNNRSKVTVVADYAGPDLTWATAVVTKNNKGDAKPRAAAASNAAPSAEPQF